MAYSYGPPPPAPPAAPSNGPGGYPSSYGQPYQQAPQRGGHGGRGRGGSDRGGYHQQAPAYGYSQPPQQYGQPNPAPYLGPHAPPANGYPPQAQQPPQWHPEHVQQHPPQPPSHAPLPAQNYHPNYAPQMYHQQPQPYSGQPSYPPAPQPHYGPSYPAPVPQQGPPAQQWGGPAQAPSGQSPYGNGGNVSGGGGGGGGRGGRGYNERGGHKGQMMGPPIRIGFDGSGQQAPAAAPVSSPYTPQQYGGPQGSPTPYPPAPYQGYPAAAPYMPGPAPYDAHAGHNNPRNHGRGGFHNNNPKSRSQFGGDKMRNRNPRGPTAQTPPAHHQKPDAASTGKKKKRKTNTLGLTPGDESDDYDENEEELDEMYGADAPKPTDIAAWIAERRANYPTKAKIDAKKAAAVVAKAQNGDATKNGDDREALLEQKAEKLRKQLEKVESSIKRKREQQDEGDDMRDLDLSSSPSSDSKSDNEKPEVMSTRQESSNVPPLPKKADPKKHCKYYSTGGTCGKRGKCRFVHDPAVREEALKEREMNGGRMTLQQRLILNDKEQEDLTIVQTLKFLQDKGLLTKELTSTSSSDAAASNAQHDQKPASLTPTPTLIKREPGSGHGLPPIPPPTVASNGATSKYSGWNLSGFGNTGVRSGDI